MSKLRMTVSRLLALGGLATISSSTYALYKYSLLGDAGHIVESLNNAVCEHALDSCDEKSLTSGKVKWDNDWDKRQKNIVHKLSDSDIVVRGEPTSDIGAAVGVVNVSLGPILQFETDEPKADVKVHPKATRHLLLVRHGHYNMESPADADRKLTKIGRRQALLTGERLKQMGIRFNRIIASTMTRAKETAELISEAVKDVPTEECSMLREGTPYPPDPISESRHRDHSKYYPDNPRIEGAFRKYFHRADANQTNDSYDLIVCHGNVIRYFVCRALQFPPEGWLRMSIGHCGVTWITIGPNGRVSLRGLGDLGHLPPDIITR